VFPARFMQKSVMLEKGHHCNSKEKQKKTKFVLDKTIKCQTPTSGNTYYVVSSGNLYDVVYLQLERLKLSNQPESLIRRRASSASGYVKLDMKKIKITKKEKDTASSSSG
jgi:hypothetical protein